MKVSIVPQWEAAYGGTLFEKPEQYDPRLPAGSERIFYIHLKKKFESNGHTLDTIDNIGVNESDIIMFVGFREGFDYYRKAISESKRPYLVYVAREPPAYTPQNSSKGLLKLNRYFDTVFTWIDGLVDNDGFSKYHWPISESQLTTTETKDMKTFEKRKLLTNISSMTSSTHVNELYSERERVVEFYDTNYPESFTQYGHNWNSEITSVDICNRRWSIPKYEVYGGAINKKSDAYENHRFGLSFENMTGVNGWISEKIFDVFASGAVPVYWGASNVEEYIPKGTFIDYREFANPKDLHQHLVNIDEDEYAEYRSNIEDFLEGDAAQFAAKNVADTFYEEITDLVDSTDPFHILDTTFIDELEESYRTNDITYARTVSESVKAFMDPPGDLERFDVTRKFVKAAYNEFVGSS